MQNLLESVFQIDEQGGLPMTIKRLELRER